ncbi:MAG TPA: hypothetical protein VNF02_01855 [Candidatus Limnocylindrales bacterium]|nr:hypothetical protein [Candidatus Limnocylindrales bacterium]
MVAREMVSRGQNTAGGPLEFLGRIFRYVIWAIVAAGIAWVVKKAFQNAAAHEQAEGARERARVDAQPIAKALFRDPVCGTYVAEDISYFWQQGTETLHFCSRDCMEHYRRDHHLDDRGGNRLAAGA